jgi:hypothetical protein
MDEGQRGFLAAQQLTQAMLISEAGGLQSVD